MGLLVGGVDANPWFPSLSGEVIRTFELSPISALRKGFIVPVLRCAANPPTFESIDALSAFYVVGAVHEDGVVDLSLVADCRPHGLLPLAPLHAWLVFHPPLPARSIPVMAGNVLTMELLPPEVRAALTARRISACAPSSPRALILNDANSHSTDVSRGSLLREIAAAPLRRALHGDVAMFHAMVGPSGDISSKQFLNTLRNLQTSSVLHRLPFLQPDHLEAFLTFRWGRELSFASKKAEACHLALFRAVDARGAIQPFRSAYDVATALNHLELACYTLFRETVHRPFFVTIFQPLQRLMRSRDLLTSLSAVPIDFLVWKISGLLVEWSLLYTLEAYASMSFEAFLAQNVAVLFLDPQAVRAEVVTLDMKLLPRQYGDSSSSSGSGSSSQTVLSSPASARKRSFSKVRGTSSPSAPSTGPNTSSSVAASAPTKGKYHCIADQCHMYDPVTYPACPRGSDCRQIHAPKPTSGKIAGGVRAELIASVAAMKHMPGAKRTQLTTFFTTLP
jgi:hypothetical protein